MESRRQAKFARMVQRDLSDIFLKEGEKLFNKRFITVSNVRVSPDLGYVKVYLTFMGEKEPDKILTLIKLYSKDIRTFLAQRIKNEVKKIPELEFFYDDTMDYVEKMDNIFTDLNKNPKSTNALEDEYEQDTE